MTFNMKNTEILEQKCCRKLFYKINTDTKISLYEFCTSTLSRPGGHRFQPKFQFYFKKGGIIKKISYERRAYESVDKKSLS